MIAASVARKCWACGSGMAHECDDDSLGELRRLWVCGRSGCGATHSETVGAPIGVPGDCFSPDKSETQPSSSSPRTCVVWSGDAGFAPIVARTAAILVGEEVKRMRPNYQGKALAHARIVCCFILRRCTKMSYSEIADAIGLASHSRAIDAFRKFGEMEGDGDTIDTLYGPLHPKCAAALVMERASVRDEDRQMMRVEVCQRCKAMTR